MMAYVKRNDKRIHAPFSFVQQVPGSPDFVYQGDYGSGVEESVYLGDSPPDWRARIIAGRDASSELIGDRWLFNGNNVKYETRGLKYPILGQSVLTSGKPDPLAVYCTDAGIIANAAAENQAAGAILNSYKGAVTHFRGLDFAAEFLEVIQLLTNPLKGLFGLSMGLAKEVKKFRKWAHKRPSYYAERIGGAYLSFTFGVQPLLSDAQAAAETAATLMNEVARKYDVTIKGFGQHFERTFGPLNHQLVGCAYARQRIYGSLNSEVRYRGKVGIDLTNPYGNALFAGFTPPDIIPAVWEGLPFSFLVDYFTNVGDVLYRGTTASSSPNVRYITKGVRNTSEVMGLGLEFSHDDPDVLNGYISGSSSGGSFVTRRVRVHRSSGVELPPVTLNFDVPGVKQVFNVAALVTAVLSSKPPVKPKR
jgi:hypothetical protein